MLVAALEQADFVGPRLGFRGAGSVMQHLRSGGGVGALAGHRSLSPPFPTGPRALHKRGKLSAKTGQFSDSAGCPRPQTEHPIVCGPASVTSLPHLVTSAQGPVLQAGGQL